MSEQTKQTGLSLVSWNVNSIRVRQPHLANLLTQHQPDIVCLQETKVTDDLFPTDFIREIGYEVIFSGQKTYNGVAILYRKNQIAFETPLPNSFLSEDPQKRFLAARFKTHLGIFSVASVYVPNGQEVDSQAYQYKLSWLNLLKRWIEQQQGHIAILGDFNIAPTDADVYNPEGWKEQILCSSAERAAFKQLLDLGLTDTVAEIQKISNSVEPQFTWWDYRQARFVRNQGLRIDHVLLNTFHQFQASFWIDRQTRSLEKPSDHAPVFLYLSSNFS
jgi:exodeoxyribonuclease-3